jgi:hypothetical protein
MASSWARSSANGRASAVEACGPRRLRVVAGERRLRFGESFWGDALGRLSLAAGLGSIFETFSGWSSVSGLWRPPLLELQSGSQSCQTQFSQFNTFFLTNMCKTYNKCVKNEPYQIFTNLCKPTLAFFTSILQKFGSKWLQKNVSYQTISIT